MAASDPYSQINTYMTAAVTAIAARDYATALDNALAAEALVEFLQPDLVRDAGAGGGQQRMTWDRESIGAFIVRIQRLKNASLGATGIAVVDNTYQNYPVDRSVLSP